MLRSKIGKVDDNTAVDWPKYQAKKNPKFPDANNKTGENYMAHLYSIYIFDFQKALVD
jgi:hypothetical protein